MTSEFVSKLSKAWDTGKQWQLLFVYKHLHVHSFTVFHFISSILHLHPTVILFTFYHTVTKTLYSVVNADEPFLIKFE